MGSRFFARLGVLVFCPGLFVWMTRSVLPPVVASHFDGAGRANGFMDRGSYIGIMLAVAIVGPAIAGLLPRLAIRRPGARINLPHRDYWLAPERRGATLDFIAGGMAIFGGVLAVFLCYVHWLVVQANTRTPPVLPPSQVLPALVLVLAAVAALVVSIFVRFGRAPR